MFYNYIKFVTNLIIKSVIYFKDDDRHSEQLHRSEADNFDREGDEEEYSDADDFIVDDDGRPIADKRKKRKPIFTDA